jgi:serine/threonine-protein kinase RsbW
MYARLTIEANLDQLSTVRQFIAKFTQNFCVQEVDADESYLYDLTLAVDEVVTNIIVHGYKGQPGVIHLTLIKNADDLEVILKDDAPPFDPTQVPTPNINVPLDKRQPGGLGVFLARTLTDRMLYRHLPQGGNELKLLKRCPIKTDQ